MNASVRRSRLARSVSTLFIVAAAATLTPWVAGASAQSAPRTVRPLQPRGERLLAAGIQRSWTFKRLLDELAQTDIVAYVDLTETGPRGLDGMTTFSGTAGDVRYVRVWLRPDRIDDHIIATLGHELQHVLEIARAPQVTSEASLVALYRTIGRSSNPGRYETRTAAEAEARIRAEILR
ncbi:MAG: hypothetical protein ACM3NQ_03740 [Bacteroidales bacterium]